MATGEMEETLLPKFLALPIFASNPRAAVPSPGPSRRPSRVPLSAGCVGLLTVAHPRGVRGSGLLFALPTYGFVGSLYAMLAVGIGKCATGSCPHATAPHPIAAGAGAVG